MRVAFSSEEMFNYMIEEGLNNDKEAIVAAAAIGTPTMLSRLATSNSKYRAHELAGIAAGWGNYLTMTYVIKNFGYTIIDLHERFSIIYSAAKGGNIRCFSWLCNYMSGLYRMDIEKLVNIICKRGHFEIFKYIYENKGRWFLPGRGGRMFTWKSAEFNHVEWLRWLYENKCEWDEDTPDMAAENDSIDCLKFAIENGCRISELIYMYARGSPRCKEYIEELVKNGKIGSWYLLA